MDKKKIGQKIIKEAIDDLEVSQRSFHESEKAGVSTDRAWLNPSAPGSKESPHEETTARKTKRRGILSLNLWVYVLLSRIYLLFPGLGPKQTKLWEHHPRE